MSLVPGVKNMHDPNPAINNFVHGRREWISYSDITDIKPTQIDNVYYAIHKRTQNDGIIEETTITLPLLGSSEECTPTLVSEVARIYSLSTHKYNNDVSQYRRYKEWLSNRNALIIGFTNIDNDCYMVADEQFYYRYSRYGLQRKFIKILRTFLVR